MEKKIVSIILLSSLSAAQAWDFGVKTDVQKGYTDNVNLANTAPVKDEYSILSGYLQAKNESLKLKLKGKIEKYNKQNENDNYSTDLSLQYKATKSSDYTFGVFKQVYNGTPAVSTDTTSDNNGLRMAANFNHDFVKSTSMGYISFSGSVKNYTNDNGRKDKILGINLGLEQNLSNSFLIVPEISFQHIGSNNSYYNNNSYGPNILLSFTPDDTWEWFGDANFSRTDYSGRSVTRTVGRNTVTEKEYQELFSTDLGVIYSFPQYISLTGKYTHSKNNSNNSTSGYKADVFFAGIGLKL